MDKSGFMWRCAALRYDTSMFSVEAICCDGFSVCGCRIWTKALSVCFVSTCTYVWQPARECVFTRCGVQNSNRSGASTPPEASGPVPEHTGPSSLSLSVNNCSSRRPALCYFWSCLTSFKDSTLTKRRSTPEKLCAKNWKFSRGMTQDL